MISSHSRLLRRAEASQYLFERFGLKRSVSTLAKYAVHGGGPKFRKDGRVPLYPPEFLDQWAEGQLSAPVSSTTEYKSWRRSEDK